jgi:uncharacterized membrane protein
MLSLMNTTTNKEPTMTTESRAAIKDALADFRDEMKELTTSLRGGREEALAQLANVERALSEVRVRISEAR